MTETDPLTQAGNPLAVLLEVEVPVSISFGRCRLALKDVLKLTSGSIVELDRAVEDDVDVIVNNRVVARGEVVSADGNYAVRIREVVGQKEVE